MVQVIPGRVGYRLVAGLALLAVLGVGVISCGPARNSAARPRPGAMASAWPGMTVERLRPVALTRPLRVAIHLQPEAVAVHVSRPASAADSTQTDGSTGAGIATAGSPLAKLTSGAGDLLGHFSQLTLQPEVDGITVTPVGHAGRTLGDTLRIDPPPDGFLQLDTTIYRGSFEIYRQPSGELTVVNLVELEDYLLGVVPLEIGYPPLAAREAVKAQAVAARTYVLSHLERWPEAGFDVFGDVRDQAYGGCNAERDRISAAVRETVGIVATYDGLLLGAFYSACCGGQLGTAHETWGFAPFPYLHTHRDRRGDADFCMAYKYYRWQHRWSASEFMALLKAHYVEEFGGERPPAGPLEDVSIEGRFQSGRVRSMMIRAGGRRYELGGDRVRWVLRRGGVGGAILYSSHFDLELERRQGRIVALTASGAGNGHGVGMCQAGALEMARQGYDFSEILEHYYPGTSLTQLWPS